MTWLKRIVGWTAVLFVATLAMGCAPRWQVVKQATPNPFVGANKVMIEPVTYPSVGETGDDKEDTEKHKEEVAATFIEVLKEEAGEFSFVTADGEGVIVVRAQVTRMTGGVSMGLASTAARIEMTVQLLKGGEVQDEILLAEEYSQGDGVRVAGFATSGYTDSDRLEETAKKLGDIAADYLETRVESE